MAALKVLNEQPERIVLGKGGISAFGTLAAMALFGCVAAVGFGFLAEGDLNPVVIVILFVIGFALLSSFANAVASTRIVLDANQRSATRTDALLFIPTRRQEIAFNLIRDVQVTRAGGAAALAMDSFPIWQVQLRASDGSTLVVNERGARAEMDALAEKVGALLNRPVRAENETKKQTTETNYTPASVMTSLVENLAAFAQSAAPASLAPPISAFPNEGARQEQMERAPRGQRPRRNATRPPPPNTLASPTTSANLAAPFDATGAPRAFQQTAFETNNAFNAPPVAYSAPPVLVMPQLPGMMSFGPAMDMPSFPALGFGMEMPAIVIPDSREFKNVQAQVSAPPTTPRATNDARQLYTNRNFRDAQAAYLRALNENPADGALHNDLGVVYYAQNKMQDAERAFRRAVALDPFSNASRYNLGLALHRLGRKNEAYEQFKVGAQNSNGEDAAFFRDALRGALRAPVLSQ